MLSSCYVNSLRRDQGLPLSHQALPMIPRARVEGTSLIFDLFVSARTSMTCVYTLFVPDLNLCVYHMNDTSYLLSNCS